MPRYPLSGGVTRLSQLSIDAGKDWGGFTITDIARMAAGMSRGDLLAFDGTKLVKISPTDIGDELTSFGPGNQVGFAPPVQP